MSGKKIIKILISCVAATLAMLHLLFPQINIDIITVALICLAIIPWVEPLFKSVGVPGGLSFQFHDLEEAGADAKRAGIINKNKKNSNAESIQITTYDFIEIAEENPGLALRMLQASIEKNLLELAKKYSLKVHNNSTLSLIDELNTKNILDADEARVMKKVIVAMDTRHQEVYDYRMIHWIKENGPPIINYLQSKLH